MPLQKVKASTDEYKKLCKAALECLEEAKFDGKAETVFKTRDVQEALSSSMQTIISALELISRYYSKTRGGELLLIPHDITS